jgi:thioredoxin reductase (NADPH)
MGRRSVVESRIEPTVLDLLVVGAGPTGIAIGAEARKAGMDFLLIDRGPLVANLLAFPTFMRFFTTRDLLEVGGIPFAVPDDKPDRRQAIAYYQSVARAFELPLAVHEEVIEIRREEALFIVTSQSEDQRLTRRTKAVALATGYFHNPRRLGVEGEEQPWVRYRYLEPYAHFGLQVIVVGGGNSAAETALDLWRNGAMVTLVHRGETLKPSIKYWLKPDAENRIEEGSIEAYFCSTVVGFGDHEVEIEGPDGRRRLPADAAYVLIGYTPEVDLMRRSGVALDDESLVPEVDLETCESNVPGLYLAGTLQAGRRTDKIFIENSRDHGARIVSHLRNRLLTES